MTVKRGIDHLVLCVNDLELCAAFYRQLGFTTTPRARHPWGTDNCLIQLAGSFIELLAVSRPSLIYEAGRRYGTMDLADLPESPNFLGFSVQTSDLDLVAGHLRKNRIPYEISNQLIRVHPKDAFGVLVEFRK